MSILRGVLHFYLGVFFLQNEDFTQAKTYLIKSLALDEEQSETHLNLGICYYRLKQLESALYHFDRLYSLDHQNYDAISNKGLVLLRMKNILKLLVS
ncbi:MAG: tetratricopeptide repeat protein [Paenibacillaceae bacterium]|nr:tetratricopeptide repeat protein [Paenibacillaceae bacterium]